MKHKLISIGYLGSKRCYLNVNDHEAIQRYCFSESMTSKQFDENEDIQIDEFEFDDEFCAYDIYEK